MCFSIVILPLIGSFFSGLFGRYLGRFGSIFISIFCMCLVTIIAYLQFYKCCLSNELYFITFGSWIQSNLLVVNWGFMFDSITMSMLIMISTVSTVVHIYGSNYMSGDPHVSRFMSYLSLFTFFMFLLITADNFIQLFLGWEGVGVCSYLLINFWFSRIQANKSAIKALIMNRIGDFGLLIGIIIVFYFFRSTDFAFIFTLAPYFVAVNFKFFSYKLNILFIITFFLFIGSMGKSAQIGLHTWLPCAMEGPTPVSALIHAATMVTAGVFLIIRCSPLFEYSADSLLIITIIGSMTAFFAASIGIVQNDMKKVIAYSTCSQLGYMIFACGISAYNVSFFHLINHAFFKALLFLGSGIIIHALNNEQDMRRMGGLLKILPYSYNMMLIGSLALIGFPFLSGFYSKDLILESAYSQYKIQSIFSYNLGTLSAFFTGFYSGRLLYLTFLGFNNQFRWNKAKIYEANESLGLSLLILVVGSIFSGFIFKDMFVGFGSVYFDNSILILSSNSINFDIEKIPLIFKLLPTVCTFGGLSLSYLFYSSNYIKIISKFIIYIYTFLNQKWFFDLIYNYYIGNYILWSSYVNYYKIIDKGFLEYFGATGIIKVIYKMSLLTLKFQTGFIYHYISIMFLSIFLFFIYFDIYFF